MSNAIGTVYTDASTGIKLVTLDDEVNIISHLQLHNHCQFSVGHFHEILVEGGNIVICGVGSRESDGSGFFVGRNKLTNSKLKTDRQQ